MMKLPKFAPKPKNLLEGFSGVAKPGEMVLVLGRPGSGCSTFLKTISNNHRSYLGVEGSILYGGIPFVEMEKRYPGEAVYNAEDDTHHATLSVWQTIQFALKLKTPGKLLSNETKKTIREEVGNTILKMLGISHTKGTKVGNAYVRGISGGERKRVSIAEMMTTRAAICAWDNSTRGLDGECL